MLGLLKTALNKPTVRRLSPILFNTTRKHILIYLILLIVFTVEVLTYYYARFRWNSIYCTSQETCTKILLVADPQLIGLNNEIHHWATPFSIWDSDRYLYKTYSHAFQSTKPDIVIFLGDLFDEGSIATNAEFKLYLRRLYDIFLQKSLRAHHFWLPGDNDIGGENGEAILPFKIKRFEHAFLQPDIMKIRNVKFYKINRLTSTIPKFSYKNDFNSLDIITIGVSHMPLLMSPAVFVDKLFDKLQPHVVFSAHSHKSMIISTQMNFRRNRLITPVRPDDNIVYEFELGEFDVYEMVVPTCSYRMGTDKIGYGFAVIEDTTIRYTVLWTPSRLTQLLFYCYVLILGLIVAVLRWCYLCCKKKNIKKNTSIYDNHRDV